MNKNQKKRKTSTLKNKTMKTRQKTNDDDDQDSVMMMKMIEKISSKFPNHSAMVVVEFVKFLMLKKKENDTLGLQLSPSLKIDALWHKCILCTALYEELQQLLGFKVHHDLKRALDDEQTKTERRKNTFKQYIYHFNSNPPVTVWDQFTLLQIVNDDIVEMDKSLFVDKGQIFLKTLVGSTAVISIDSFKTTTLLQLMKRVEEKTRVPIEQQRLIFSGAELNDKKATLDSLNIRNESTLHMVVKLGGC